MCTKINFPESKLSHSFFKEGKIKTSINNLIQKDEIKFEGFLKSLLLYEPQDFIKKHLEIEIENMKSYLEFKNFISVKYVTLKKENDWEFFSCDFPYYFNRGICFHLIICLIKKKFMSFPEPIYEPK